MSSRKRARIDKAIRTVVLDMSPESHFEEGVDTLLRLGCLLYLERLANESREVAAFDGKKHVNAQVVKKAAKSVVSDIRQF